MVAYGALLPQSALDIPPHGWVNLHFSCLPAWRGAAPVQHAIWAGDEVTGATTFRIVKEIDAGPTYGVMTERIRPTDTAGDLLGRLAEGGAGLLVATLDGIEDGSLEARPQPEDGDQLRAEDHRRRRTGGLARPRGGGGPADPGLHAGARRLDDVRRAAGQARAGDRHRRACSRRASCGSGKAEVLVGTGTTAVRLGEVKAFGSRQMAAADWARGVRLPGGHSLRSPASPTGESSSVGAVTSAPAGSRRPRTSTRSAWACPRSSSGSPGATARPTRCAARGSCCYRAPHKTADRPRDRRAVRRPARDPGPERDREAGAGRGRAGCRSSPSTTSRATTPSWSSSPGSASSSREELAEIITDAWLTKAPKSLAKSFLADG